MLRLVADARTVQWLAPSRLASSIETTDRTRVPEASPHSWHVFRQAAWRKGMRKNKSGRRKRPDLWGASVARCPPNRANSHYLRSESSRSHTVIVGIFRFGPVSAVPCRAKTIPLLRASSLFRPHEACQSYRMAGMAHRQAGLVEAPGTAPGSATPIPNSVYRHSRTCRHVEYSHSEVKFKETKISEPEIWRKWSRHAGNSPWRSIRPGYVLSRGNEECRYG